MRRRLTEPERSARGGERTRDGRGTGGRHAAARVPAAHAPYTAGLAAAAVSLPLEPAPRRGGEARGAAPPGCRARSNMPIDHFVVLMMENRSFDHYFGWLPDADGVQDRTYQRPRQRRRAGQHPARLDARRGRSGRAAATPTPTTRGTAAARSSAARSTDPTREPDGFLAGDNDEFALCYYDEGDLGFIHPAGREFTVYDRFHCSLMASTWPNRYYMWSAQSGGKQDNNPPADTLGNQWETLFDRALKSNPANLPGPGRDRPLLQLRPAVLGGLGAARRDLDAPGRRLLRRLRGRHAAQHHVRRPALPRRRRRRRRVGRRAPARRRAPRPGVHVRRRARVHGVAELGARRAVHRLRRVGRLLRPRAAAERARRPPQLQHRPGLRADGLPHPGASWSRPSRTRGTVSHQLVRLRVDHQADHLPLRARQPHDARRPGARTSARP